MDNFFYVSKKFLHECIVHNQLYSFDNLMKRFEINLKNF